MASATPPADGPPKPRVSTAELPALWDRFRSGGDVPCRFDRATLALAIDASAGIYRFVCTQCGAASTWFQSGPSGINVHGAAGDQRPRED